MQPILGVIGVGTIAAAMVRGLRQRWPSLAVLLSPRSERVGFALALEDALVRRAVSNRAVVDECDIVILSMLPVQLEEALRETCFRSGQIVVSCLANTSLEDISALVAPATVCRMIPLPMIERGMGPLVLYPALPSVCDLFDNVGDLVAVSSEAEFQAYGAASATMSTFFALQSVLVQWLMKRGASAEEAKTYVHSMQRALAETSVRCRDQSDALVEEHETSGGLNERMRTSLLRADWFGALASTLDALYTLRGSDLAPAASMLQDLPGTAK